MLFLDINDVEQLNITFCELVGIKPIRALLIAEDGEVKPYTTTNCIYRKPKGWENSEVVTFDYPKYPDFTEEHNFCILINIQWELFGNLGDQYLKMKEESFPVNYLYTKIKAIQTMKAYGGSDMLNEFCERVRNSDYEYFILPEEEI